MLLNCKIGDTRLHVYTVQDADVAAFSEKVIHPVFSTFALAREAEWSGRLFVLEMKEAHEEGIGTGLTIQHHAPAFVGDRVVFRASLIAVFKNEVTTYFQATVGERLIAEGQQKQKILPTSKIASIFASLRHSED